LPHSHSDHCPVVVSLYGSNVINRVVRMFHFVMAWQTHADFSTMLQASWRDNVELLDSLLSLEVSLGEWNKSSFGNIFKRKRHLLACLDGVRKALEIEPNPFLFRLEKDLMTEYKIVLVQEESFLY
ncbi:hypothetical protein E1A91_A12G083800v1, partial [Gossypium mustelinum]